MVLCVAALPLVGGADGGWPTWALACAAFLLPVVAAVLLARAARREDEVFGALSLERDGLAASLADTTRALQEATTALVAEQEARADERVVVESAVVSLSRKVQASAHRVQEEAARMVQRHPADPDVLESSMRIDHAAAQHARQAQSLVALCGRRPGQTWDEPLPLPDVVHAAAGRITAFGRVEVSGDPGLAVVGRAVEPLVHAVAELLANATQCSPPNTRVLVVLRQVQRGAVIEIDDCGVGMDARELARVRAVATGETVVGIAQLGEVPQTGLAVVGTYARFLGLRVDLTESVYGGVRAVVMVPGELTETAEATPRTLAASAHEAWGESSVPSVPAVPAGPASGDTGDGVGGEPRRADPAVPTSAPDGPPVLPQRRSRRQVMDRPATAGHGVPQVPDPDRTATVGDGGPAGRRSPGAAAPDQTAEEAGAWIGAFFAATTEALQDDPQPSEPPVAADGTSEDR